MGDELAIGWVEQVQEDFASMPLYTNDWLVGGLIIGFFVLSAVLSDKNAFLGNMLKAFFLPHESSIEGSRVTSIFYMRVSMLLFSLLMLSLLLFLAVPETCFAVLGRGRLWLILSGGVLVSYLLKQLLFAFVNWVFYDRQRIGAWMGSYASWIILMGIPLFLLAVIAVFANFSSQNVLLMLTIGVIIFEMCLFFKSFYIFSSKKYGILQLFVYLCTLELIPLLLVGKLLVQYL